MKSVYRKVSKLCLFLVITGFFLTSGKHVYATTYTTPYVVLTGVNSSSNFATPSAATQNDGNMSNETATPYEIILKTPLSVGSFSLPSDAIMLGLRYHLYGTSNGNGVNIQPHYNGAFCGQNSTIHSGFGLSTASSPTTSTFLTSSNSFFSNCNGTGWVTPTASVVGDIELAVDSPASGIAVLGVDYATVAFDYSSASKDASSVVADANFSGNKICDALDLVCNIGNFLDNAFNYFFGYNQTFVSTQITAMQTSLNSHAPFAYINAVFSLDLSNTATSSAVPTYTLAMPATVSTPDGHGGTRSTALQTVTYTDSGSISGFLTLIRPYETIFVWVLLISWLAYEIPKRVF